LIRVLNEKEAGFPPISVEYVQADVAEVPTRCTVAVAGDSTLSHRALFPEWWRQVYGTGRFSEKEFPEHDLRLKVAIAVGRQMQVRISQGSAERGKRAAPPPLLPPFAVPSLSSVLA
jgi:hypothetical protein